MRFSTVVKIGICLILLFFTSWSALFKTQTSMERQVASIALPYEAGQFFLANKRLPHDWKEFVAWVNEIHAKNPQSKARVLKASLYEGRLALKWDDPLNGWEPSKEGVLVVIDPHFKGIEQRFNEMLYTTILAQRQKEAAEAKNEKDDKAKGNP